jgi:large subunit ribosomal protein L31
MKSGIHPQVHTAQIHCSCGNKLEIGNTTVKEIHIEVCSACHPFYTGKQKLVDTAGRVDKFRKKMEAAQGAAK